MSDWFPQVVKIEEVKHHPNGDNLDIVTVLGDYPLIAKRDEYKVGDVAAYIPIDSIVPDTEQFYFLCPRQYEKYEEDGEIKQRAIGPKYLLGSVPEKNRIIKAKKIRGIYSQGMLVGIDTLPVTGTMKKFLNFFGLGKYKVGDPITDALGLKKWEEEEEDNLPTAKSKGKNAEKAPDGWSIPYYDIDGLRKYIKCIGEDEEIVLTEKLHGSNAAFCHDGERLWVKSRNFYKKMDEEDMWWDIALRYRLQEKLAAHPFKVFFGEVVGNNKGYRYNAEVVDGKLLTKIFFFDVFDVKTKRYLDYDDRVDLISSVGLDPVPELYRGKWNDKEKMYAYAEGKTTLGGKHIREGFVLCTVKERYEPRLDSRMQVKLVGETYNLQK